MARPLQIDEAELRELRNYAEQNFIDINEMRKIVAGDAPPVGDRPNHAIMLNFGFRVVFSIEEHPRNDKNRTIWCRHMSMSVDSPGCSPNQFAVGTIGEILGFPTKSHQLDYDNCAIWLEGDDIINVMCEIKNIDPKQLYWPRVTLERDVESWLRRP